MIALTFFTFLGEYFEVEDGFEDLLFVVLADDFFAFNVFTFNVLLYVP